jgi:hypothetical protein
MSSGFGSGGINGRRPYADDDLVEACPVLDAFTLHHAQALLPGAMSAWQWPALTIGIYADASGIAITDGEHVQRVAIKRWRVSSGRFVSFLCPQCQRGAYKLYWREARWACRTCHRLEHAVWHRHRWKKTGITNMLDLIERRAKRL